MASAIAPPPVPAAAAGVTSSATVARAARRATSTLAVLLLASAPREGRPFLFPGTTLGRRTAGTVSLEQPEDARLTLGRNSRVRVRGGALQDPDYQSSKKHGLGSLQAGGGAASIKGAGRSKKEEQEAGFGTRVRASLAGRRRHFRNEASPGDRGSKSHGDSVKTAHAASTHFEEESLQSRPNSTAGEDSVLTAGELLVQARDVYSNMFGEPGDPEEISAGYAPGRVNLIGEHTDYNGGFVMPLALDRGTVMYGTGRLINTPEHQSDGNDAFALENTGDVIPLSGPGAYEDDVQGGSGISSKASFPAGQDDYCCRVVSESVMRGDSVVEGDADVSFRADASLAPGEPEWANYVKGVVKEYTGRIPEGKTLIFKAVVVSTVPIGGGVSSSASLCVATATFLDGIFANVGIAAPSVKEKAHMCRMAEHRFMSMPCGIMDQFVTSMAKAGHAMLLDCRSEDPADVPLADSSLVIVVTNSNVKHKLAGSQYPVRVAQCQAARDELRKRHPEVELLRDTSVEQVEEIEDKVEQAVFRRARHVVSENLRTVAAAEALGKRDYRAAGRFMLESHHSLKEDYEVSCPELDLLVELAMEVGGVYGSRLTGGGFGGCTVTLTDKDSVGTLVKHLQEGYARSTGKECTCFVTQPGFGARGLSGPTALSASTWPNT